MRATYELTTYQYEHIMRVVAGAWARRHSCEYSVTDAIERVARWFTLKKEG